MSEAGNFKNPIPALPNQSRQLRLGDPGLLLEPLDGPERRPVCLRS